MALTSSFCNHYIYKNSLIKLNTLHHIDSCHQTYLKEQTTIIAKCTAQSGIVKVMRYRNLENIRH